MGGVFHYDLDSGMGYYMDDEEIAEAGGYLLVGMGAMAVFYLVVSVIAFALISPFITLFVLDDFVETIIGGNVMFFLVLGIGIAALRLPIRTTGLGAIRFLFDTYIVITVLYIVLYILHFDTPVYSCLKIIDGYLPSDADRSFLMVLGVDEVSFEGNWFHQLASDSVARFVDYIRWCATNVMRIDSTCFQAPASQFDIFAVVKTVLLYIGIGGFSIITVVLMALLMALVIVLSVVLPYLLALVAVVVCNKMIFRFHTTNRRRPSKESMARYNQELEASLSSNAPPETVFAVSQKLASNKNPLAYINLAQCYLHGEGALPNEKKAFGWYLKAASVGITKAQIMVAILYFHGIGVKKNRLLAKMWLTVAQKDTEYLKRHQDRTNIMEKLALIRRKTRYSDCI